MELVSTAVRCSVCYNIVIQKYKVAIMVATVRINSALEEKLDYMTTLLHKKKSDVIREAISFYAKSLEDEKSARILKAVSKTKDADKKELEVFEGTVDDNL